MTETLSDAPRVYKVSEVAHGIKRILEERTVGTWVGGEVGRVQRSAGGHVYFVLKDEGNEATLDCVLYRREALRFGRLVEEGARIELRGRASFYPPRGRLQWIGEVVRPSGRGALLLELERLKQRLGEEGLFAPERKRPLPIAPRVIGVVTSRQGAAFHDICRVARQRGQVRIILVAAVVQGEEAPSSILRALDLIDRYEALEALIVGRGGGAQEDLAAFNDERVVRRLARMRVPVVSAVGHEIDNTLADLVCDARAATPSHAAEMLVADDKVRRARFVATISHLRVAFRRRLNESALRLSRLERELGDPRFAVAERRQELDEVFAELQASLLRRLRAGERQQQELSARLGERHPRTVTLAARARLFPLVARLGAGVRGRLSSSERTFVEHVARLDALSPLAVLARGYALVFRGDGRALRRSGDVEVGDTVRVRLGSGGFVAAVTARDEPS